MAPPRRARRRRGHRHQPAGVLQRHPDSRLRRSSRSVGAGGVHPDIPGRTALLLPGLPLDLAAGIAFGPVWGTIYSILGATGGATVAFLVARTVARDWVEERLSGRLARIKAGVEGEGWRFVAFVRLVPIIPFNLLNYALGLTRIRLVPYVIASFVFMLPATVAYVYSGWVGGEALAGEGTLGEAAPHIVAAFAGLGVLAAIPRLIQRWRARQREHVGAPLGAGVAPLTLAQALACPGPASGPAALMLMLASDPARSSRGRWIASVPRSRVVSRGQGSGAGDGPTGARLRTGRPRAARRRRPSWGRRSEGTSAGRRGPTRRERSARGGPSC